MARFTECGGLTAGRKRPSWHRLTETAQPGRNGTNMNVEGMKERTDVGSDTISNQATKALALVTLRITKTTA